MSTSASDMDREVFLGFIDESMESLAEAESAMIALESDPRGMDLIPGIFRAVHSLKGNSAFFGLMHVKTLAHRIEDLLDAVRQKRMQCSRQLIDALLPGLDLLRRMLENVRDGGPELTDPDVLDGTLERLDQALQGKGDAAPPAKPLEQPFDHVDAEKKTAARPAAEKAQDSSVRTLRIAESSLDAFLEHVGELIGIEEMLRYCLRQAGKTDGMGTYRELKQVVEQFCKVSAALRSGIMETRKVQAKALLEKAPRLVRDVAANKGKQIRVEIKGTDIRIDKNYSDLLDAPLVHMVRNAADHGIETPEERRQAGKSVEGMIHIELTEQENHIRLTISDDGRGLNRTALTAKAMDMGLVEPGRPLSEDDIIRLLFTSGVSTAAEITDISGRGVGMDVVKQAIESAGGQIQVDSSIGRGSVFTILLPKNVSTKIIDGYLVRGRDNITYVLPLKSVLEAFVTGWNGISTVMGQGRMVSRRDALHPVLDLDTAVREGNENAGTSYGPSAGDVTLVLLDIGGKTVALAVADIVGVQKIVVKPIDGLESKNNMIEGAAVMGDGAVALILGVKGLAGLLANTGPAAPSLSKNLKEETPS